MSRLLELTEYRASGPIRLSVDERDTLRGLIRGLTVQPIPGSQNEYTVTGGSTVGVARVGDLIVELRPKVGAAAVLFLVSYALDPRSWKAENAVLNAEANLAEAIVPLFARTAQVALRQGLLHGYRSRDEALTTIRGRVRIADQVRSRQGLPLPVEVGYDDFTPDVVENQLLRTAVDVLGRLRLRHTASREALTRLRRRLDGISVLSVDSYTVPDPYWTRLNERYRPAVSLARLILATSGLETRAGDADASAFLVDMNTVFESFIRAALREELALLPGDFPAAGGRKSLWLDEERHVGLEPDLTWWRHGRCVFVGDCKYKRTGDGADVYQLLAYLTGLGLDEGLLVYAAGEDIDRTATIRTAGKRIHVRTVDVARPPAEVLAEVRSLAHLVRRLDADAPGAATTAAS